MTSLAGDPTIRRQVMAAARDVLAVDATAPVGAIASRAGVSRATLYRHFGSRDALLESIAHEPRPPARERILAASQEMLLRSSLAELSMDDLARAADVSRGTLYRLYPGKAALLDGLIEKYSPLESVRAVVVAHPDDPPSIVLPLLARAIVGTAGVRLGLMRAMFLELTSGSEPALTGMRRTFAATIGVLADYMSAQMAAGRLRQMHPLIAIQALIGPVFFHLLSRPVIERLTDIPMDAAAAVDQLVQLSLDGLTGDC